jgi:hypothetical protein
MATVAGGQVKLNNGQLVTPQQGGWYDGQQYWGGSLSSPGQINSQSNQQGAGQQVSNGVIAQTNPANVAYIQQQQQQAPQASGGGGFTGSGLSSGGGGGAIGTGSGIGFTPAPTINLPEIYNNLYKNSGISDIEKQLSGMTQGYNDAVSKINDNPFLSEATRVGRLQKLSTDYENRTLNTKNDIATKKADVEMQLNLQTKQFDINSQVAKDELARFNMLLESGALEGTSGEDIANITRATGLSSSMIQSAVDANRAKNTSTSTIQFDDGTNQGFAIINDKTGEIINRQVVSQSKPSAAEEKAALGGGGGGSSSGNRNSKVVQLLGSRANSYGDVSYQDWRQILAAYIADGGTKAQFEANFSNYADTNRGDFLSAYGFENPQKPAKTTTSKTTNTKPLF